MAVSRGVLLAGVVLCLAVVAGGLAVADEHGDDAPHEHPDEAGEDGDLEEVAAWLAGRMTEIHLDCAEGVTVGEYDVCDRLDDDYPEHLERFADVERETTGDDGTSETFEEAGETHREFVDDVREFRRTHDEYREARAAGDEERARTLARDLVRIGDRIGTRGDHLEDLLADLDRDTDRNVSDAGSATRETTDEVDRIREQVESESFQPTELSVDRSGPRASFSEPVTLSGRLTDDNGTALTNEPIVLLVDNRSVGTTTTGGDGTYAIEYRPTSTETGPTTLNVTYAPEDASPYLGGAATTVVEVQQVEPSVRLDETPETASFGAQVRVVGRVDVDDVDAADVPVAVSLGERSLGTVRTDDDGVFVLETTLPAAVPAGEQPLTVRASEQGLALSPARATATAVVDETDTRLAVSGAVDDEELTVRGRLTTEDGEPVSGEPVAIGVDGDARRVAVTDADGRYATSIAIDPVEADAWTVTATYDEAETNLGASRAATTVARERGAGERIRGAADSARASLLSVLRGETSPTDSVGAGGDRSLPVGPLDLAALALLAGAGGALVHVLRRGRPGDRGATGGGEAAETAADRSTDAESGAAPTAGQLAAAHDRLRDGAPRAAVQTCYGAVRGALRGDVGQQGPTDARTHWEFYRDAAATLPDDRTAPLQTLTAAYERATFDPTAVDDATAADALDAAVRCLDDGLTADGTSQRPTSGEVTD